MCMIETSAGVEAVSVNLYGWWQGVWHRLLARCARRRRQVTAKTMAPSAK